MQKNKREKNTQKNKTHTYTYEVREAEKCRDKINNKIARFCLQIEDYLFKSIAVRCECSNNQFENCTYL